MKHYVLPAIVILVLVALLIAWQFFPVGEWLASLSEKLKDINLPLRVAIFMVGAVTLMIVLCPNTPLNIASGILFGLPLGFAIAMTTGLIGSCICFIISRYVASDWASEKIEQSERGRHLIKTVNRGGFQIMLLARLNPFFPGFIKNYGFALTKVSFVSYAAATFLGQAPVILAYVYLGWAGMMTLSDDDEIGATKIGFMILGGVMTVLLAVVSWWYSRSLMEEAQTAS